MAIPYDADLGLTWLNQTESYNAGELRRADGALMAGAAGQPWGGIARHSDTAMNVTVSGGDVVTVNPGSVVIPGNAVAETGVYRGSLSSVQTGSLAARHATNPRITLVIFRALDTDAVVGHAAYKGRIEFVDGTPGAVPAAPALPTMAVELARITVPQTGGGAASVDLTYRTFATTAGGELAVPASARLPATAAKWQRAVDLATGRRYTWSGTAWVEDGGWITFGTGLTNLPTSSWVGRVSINDRTAHVRIKAVASAAASGLLQVTLPATMTSAFGFGTTVVVDGTAIAVNSGVGYTTGLVMAFSTTQVEFLSTVASNEWAQTVPHTWKSGDTLTADFSYEIA